MKSSTVLSLFAFAGVALAHLQMQDPYPIKSQQNPAVSNDDKGGWRFDDVCDGQKADPQTTAIPLLW